LTNSTQIAGLQFTLHQSQNYLAGTAVHLTSRGSAAFDIADFFFTSDSALHVLCMSKKTSQALAPGQGAVLNIDFDLDPAAPAGTIELSLSDVIVVDMDGQVVPVVAMNGIFFDPQVTAFREISKAAGFEQLFNVTCCPGAWGGAWADYDVDGDDDLLYFGFFTALFRNDGNGSFTDVGGSSSIRAAVEQTPDFNPGISAAWGDYDNDGDPDAFILAQSGARILLENNSDDTFTDMTAAAGLAVQSQGAFSVNWVDFNNDGYLDIYTSDGFLFKNNQDGTFSEVSPETGIGNSPYSGTSWADYDNDGDPDFFSEDKQQRNDQGTFVDITDSTGIVPGANFGGNLAWGDYNNDGYLDIYMTRGDFMSANLYKNDGDGSFTDVTSSAGVGLAKAGAVAWADVDNDGDLDIFVTRPAVIDSPYVLFRNNGDGTFTNIARLANMVRGAWFPGNTGAQPGQGAAWGDFNNDGKLDLFVANNTPPDFLFENRGNGAGNHFLTLTLVGTVSNKSAIGARVTVEAGGITQIREVEGGANTSQNSLPLEFGLAQAQQVDKITVRWPSGLEESTTRAIAVDQFLTLVEGSLHTVGVAETQDARIPQEFALFQNYPN
ncbi:MAG: CRTAC1 family protein, partial [Anaerolineae bacterium]